MKLYFNILYWQKSFTETIAVSFVLETLIYHYIKGEIAGVAQDVQGDDILLKVI